MKKLLLVSIFFFISVLLFGAGIAYPDKLPTEPVLRIAEGGTVSGCGSKGSHR
jgi:hypothetical protein